MCPLFKCFLYYYIWVCFTFWYKNYIVEDEFKPPSEDESSDAESSGVDENEISEPSSESDPETPIKNRKRKRPPVANGTSKSARKVLPPSSMEDDDTKTTTPVAKRAFGTPSVSSNTKSRLAAFQAVEVCWEI